MQSRLRHSSSLGGMLGVKGGFSWQRYWMTLFKARPNFALDYYAADHAAAYNDTPGDGTENSSIHGYVIDFLTEFGISSWNGYRYWMGHTPFTTTGGSDDENPCVIASNDGLTWVEPAGISNPLAPQPSPTTYNSDASLYYDTTTSTLYCIYVRANANYNERHSTDGINWSVAEFLCAQSKSTGNLVKAGSSLYFYGAGASHVLGCQTVTGGVKGSYSAVTPCVVDETGSSIVTIKAAFATYPPYIWHQETRYLHGLYFTLIFYKTDSENASINLLYLAISSDGINFRLAKYPLLSKYLDKDTAHEAGDFAWDMSFYKSSFIPYIENNVLKIRMWYIGAQADASNNYKFHCGYTTVEVKDGGLNYSDSSNAINTTYAAELVKAAALDGYVFGDNCDRADNTVINPSACGLNYTLYPGGSAFAISNNRIINRQGGVPATARSGIKLTVPVNYELTYQIDNTDSLEFYPKFGSFTSYIKYVDKSTKEKTMYVYAGSLLEIAAGIYIHWKKTELNTFKYVINGDAFTLYVNGIKCLEHTFVDADFNNNAATHATVMGYTTCYFYFAANSNEQLKNVMIKELP